MIAKCEMRRSIACGLLLIHISGCTAVAIPPEDLPYRLGRTIALDVMRELTDPRRNRDFPITIVNTALQTGLLVPPQGASAAAQFLRSNKSFLWADAAQEIALARGRNSEYLSFEILRTTLTAANCPGLTSALERFFNELEKTHTTPLATAIEAPSAPDEFQEIVIDGTNYLIQVMAGDTRLAIIPDNGRNSALNSAAMALHRNASSCTNSVPGVVEQLYY